MPQDPLAALLAGLVPTRRVPAYEIPGAMSISGWSPGSVVKAEGPARVEDMLRVLKTTPLMGSPGTVGPGIIEAETDPQKIAMSLAALRQQMAAAAAPGRFTRSMVVGDTLGGSQQALLQSRQQNIQDWNAAQERIKDMVLSREHMANQQSIAAQNREAARAYQENTLLGILSRAGASRAGAGGAADGTGGGAGTGMDWVLKAILEAGTRNAFNPQELDFLTGKVAPQLNQARAAQKTEWDKYLQTVQQAAVAAGAPAQLKPTVDPATGAVTFEPYDTKQAPTAEQYQEAYQKLMQSPLGPKIAATENTPERTMTLEDWRRALMAKMQQLEQGQATYESDLGSAKFRYPHEARKEIDPKALDTVIRAMLARRTEMAAPRPVDPVRALLEQRLGVRRP